MKTIMYGTNACPGCQAAKKTLEEKGIPFVYMEFSESTSNLKRFLKLRDTLPMFDEVKEAGAIGVPCFQMEDGTVTFHLEEVIQKNS